MKGVGKGMRPRRASLHSIHAAAHHSQHRIVRVQHRLGTIPEPKDYQHNENDCQGSLKILILPKFLPSSSQILTSIAF